MSDLTISSYEEDTYATGVIIEDSLFYKLCSCIPLLGIIPSSIRENSIQTAIAKTTNVPRLVELIDLKNQYNLCSSIRSILTVVVGIFGGMPLFSISLFFLIPAAIHFNNITKNNRIITELIHTGYRSHSEIY